jgi:hypothetical protein
MLQRFCHEEETSSRLQPSPFITYNYKWKLLENLHWNYEERVKEGERKMEQVKEGKRKIWKPSRVFLVEYQVLTALGK